MTENGWLGGDVQGERSARHMVTFIRSKPGAGALKAGLCSYMVHGYQAVVRLAEPVQTAEPVEISAS